MFRKLLATTAITAVMTAGALAQEEQQTQDATENQPLFSSEQDPGLETETGFFEADSSQILASNLIGQTVYNGATDDAEMVGDINDVVMSPEGTVEAAVIGVGGFLGIGEKEVAVEFEKISWVDRETGRWLIIDSSKEELEAAPDFDRTALLPEQPAEDDVAATDEPADATTDEQPADATTEEQADMAASEEQPAEDQTAEAQDEEVDSGATAAINPDEWQPASNEQLSAEKLIGTNVYGANDEEIGEIGDVLVTADGQLEAFIIDVGGFLGVGEKPVALDASQLQVLADGEGGLHIRTDYTQEDLEAQTAYDEQAYQENRDEILLR